MVIQFRAVRQTPPPGVHKAAPNTPPPPTSAKCGDHYIVESGSHKCIRNLWVSQKIVLATQGGSRATCEQCGVRACSCLVNKDTGLSPTTYSTEALSSTHLPLSVFMGLLQLKRTFLLVWFSTLNKYRYQVVHCKVRMPPENQEIPWNFEGTLKCSCFLWKNQENPEFWILVSCATSCEFTQCLV